MSLSKLLSSGAFRQQVHKTFILHRDLRCCLSLSQAEQMIREREVEIKQYGKTAVLQFLNSFPLNYSYKTLSSPLKIFLFTMEMQNLTTYEQQLRYTVLSKLKDYICIDDKPKIQELISQSEEALTNMARIKPFDTVHATNFLIYQKDSKNNHLFYHCLDVIKNTDYSLFKTQMHRTIPIFIKRLGIDDWNIIRRFDYLIESLVFDFVPKDLMASNYPFLIEKLTSMQIHTVCYHKIPPAIDFIYGYFTKHLEDNRDLELSKLQILLQGFNYLPLGYNQKAFNTFFNAIMQKPQSQSIHLDRLPYKRISNHQLEILFKKFGNRIFSMNDLFYWGNIVQARKAYLLTKFPEKLYEQFMKTMATDRKTFLNSIVAVSLLLEYYKQNDEKLTSVKKKASELFLWFHNDFDIQSLSKYMSFCNALTFFTINNQLKVAQFESVIKKISKDFKYRASNEDFKELNFLDNVKQAAEVYSNSPIPQVRNLLSDIIIALAKKGEKFYFNKFSQFILILCKSEYSEEYRTAVKEMMNVLKKEDCGFLVELFNRYPSKNIKLFINFLQLVKDNNSSFDSIGRFMITSSYTHFMSSRGELNLQFRRIIEEIEPTLTLNSLKGYYLPQVTFILRFCTRFYYYISQFSRKMLMLSVNYVETLDYTKDEGKFLLNFLQEAIALKVHAKPSQEIMTKMINLIKKLQQRYPENLTIKAKQMEYRWLLGMNESEDKRGLLVQELLADLSSTNYSYQHAQAMIILLKLNALEVIKLKKIMEDKLVELIINGIDNNAVKISDITNQLYLPFDKGGSSITSTASGLSSIIIMCLQKIGSKQNFQYYFRILEFANYIKSLEVLAKTLECMSEVSMSPPQIKKILQIIKFHRDIMIDKFALKLLKVAYNYFDFVKQQCQDLLFCVHIAKKDMNAEQHDLTIKILAKHAAYLKQLLHHNDKNVLPNILKHLWVSFKINQISVELRPFFRFAIDHYQDLKLTSRDIGHLKGIPNQNIALIYQAIIKFMQINDPKFLEQFKQERKGMFKSANATSNRIKNIQQTNYALFEFLSKRFPSQSQKELAQFLISQGLKPNTEQSSEKDNVFELNKSINGVILHAWARKDGIQYGIIHLGSRFLSMHNTLNGRASFAINCQTIITGIKMIGFQAGKEQKIE